MKKYLLLLVLTIAALTIHAQNKIFGTVVDNQSGETLPAATVKLLKIETICAIIGYPLKQYHAYVTRKFN